MRLFRRPELLSAVSAASALMLLVRLGLASRGETWPSARGSDGPLPPLPLDRVEARKGELAASITGFRVQVGDEGARIRARGGEEFELTLAGVGRKGQIVSAPKAKPFRSGCRTDRFDGSSDDSCRFRIERSPDGLTEWWQGDKRGLEQGWTVERRPTGDGPLSVEVVLRGEVARVEMLERANAARIVLTSGRVLLYGQIRAWDANGTPLEATLRHDGAHFAIDVDDSGAAYPVTVDPLVAAKGPINSRRTVAQAATRFGDAVAGAGDVNGDGYDDVLVGAPLYDTPNANAGRVYLYAGTPFGLSSAPLSFVQSTVTNARFGASVAAAGDVNGDGYADVLIGAPSHSAGHVFEGRVYLYLGGPSGLASTPEWSYEPDFANAGLGSAVAAADINKDGFVDILVGASNDDGNPAATPAEPSLAGQGSISVFFGSKAGIAKTPSQRFFGGAAGAHLGATIAVGDVNGDGIVDAVFGVPDATGTLAGEGRVQLHLGASAGLTKTPAWSMNGLNAGARFGAAISLGDTNGDGKVDLVVGSPGYSNGEALEGRVVFFVNSGTGFSANAADVSRNAIEYHQPNANAASGVAVIGDASGDGFGDVAVAFPAGLGKQQTSQIYLGTKDGPSQKQLFINKKDATGGVPKAGEKLRPWLDVPYSGAVAAAGDIDGDGFADVVFGEIEGLCVNKCWDYDGDGYEDSDELDANPALDPSDWDTDGDSCGDFIEGAWYDSARARNPNLKPLDLKTCDADKDGLSNAEEAALGTNPDLADSDGDTIDDFTETHGGQLVDSDGDKKIDALDLDSDGDGVPDALEGTRDRDLDRVPAYRDTDDDNDGIPTATEFADSQRVGSNDVDGDGLFNWEDADADGDGKRDDLADVTKDDDADNIPNYLDRDDAKPGPFFGAPPAPGDAGTTPGGVGDGGASDAGVGDAGPIVNGALPPIEDGCAVGPVGRAGGETGSRWLSVVLGVGLAAAARRRRSAKR